MKGIRGLFYTEKVQMFFSFCNQVLDVKFVSNEHALGSLKFSLGEKRQIGKAL